ncbi:hypothetical protein ABZY32_16490 [Nocardiopsis alba]|uniref:hypothetical protein n=1 Tax=Nocardiopsis alba TaxID=53437 RepID=UPI0033B095B9
MKFGKRRGRPTVVDTVNAQTDQASALAGIRGQSLLGNPRTNPAVREHADRLRDDQQRDALTLEHRRAIRKGRVADRRAAHAEKALEAITTARETASPALSVVALHTGRRRYTFVALAASLALSVGSALGVEALAQSWGAQAGVGYLAEIGLTGLSTATILYRSHLAQHTHRDTTMPAWQSRVLWALMLVPLLGSIAASTAGSGPVGALCSVGAAAFALLAYLVADRSSTVLRDTAALVDRTDEEQLRREAAGEDLFALPGDDQAEEIVDGDDVGEDPDAWAFDGEQAFADQVEAFVRDHQDPPESPTTSSSPHGLGDGPQGAAKNLPESAPHIDTGDHQIDADQRFDGLSDRDGGESTEKVIPASQARRLKGLATRYRVAEYMASNPSHTVSQIAAALDLGESTVYRHKRAIDADNGGYE